MRWKANFAGHDLLIYLHRFICVKRWEPGYHFINKNTQCPPIHSLAVSLGQDDLRSQIFRGSAQCPSSAFDNLCKAKICDLYVTCVTWIKTYSSLSHENSSFQWSRFIYFAGCFCYIANIIFIKSFSKKYIILCFLLS